MLEFLIVMYQMLSRMTEKEVEEFKTSLTVDWKRPGTYQLTGSHTTISLPDGYRILLGDKVKQKPGFFCEAIVHDDAFETTIVFDDFKTGYIALDTWNQIDPVGFLESLQENEKRAGHEYHTIGWLQKPLLDKATNTIYWAVEREGHEQRFVHATALRLYREGCSTVTCIIDIEDFVPFDGLLHAMLQSCSFDPAVQYHNYQIGDPIAEGGIAAFLARLFTKHSDLAVEEAEGPGTHQLAQSHSTFFLPEGFKLFKERLTEQVTGMVCEATVFDTFNNVILFENLNCGYISLYNWELLDPIGLMKSIQQNEKKISEEQVRNGGPELSKTLGWLQEPVLDSSTNTIYWAIEIQKGEQKCVNAVALRLHLEGFEKITWITENLSSFVPFGGSLGLLLKSHHFDPGFHYEDYKADDLPFDIMDVVAVLLGGDESDEMDNSQSIPEADLKDFASSMEPPISLLWRIFSGVLWCIAIAIRALQKFGYYIFMGMITLIIIKRGSRFDRVVT